ncbi:MAG: glycosyltransferase family 39 protein [Bacteroidetes bacterium]|nr:glycosyltransferase family 39 protein [Bacteroidota bacterium]
MSRNFFIYSLLAACLICVIGMLGIPLIDIDAAQYASMSREMASTGNYLQLYDLGKDYLDKPPLLFWLSSISIQLFGVHDWAYRLPSILCLGLALWSVYRFTLLYYNELTAQFSVLVLASSQAFILMAHDVRCDTMLMGFVMFSIWQLAAWYQSNAWKHFVMAFIGIGLGMLTKGPIAIVVPGVSFAIHFLLQRNWKQFFRWEYIIGVLIVGILLIPMSIGLYTQFDLQPGKIIHGVPIKSGLRFYYWTQSFGRYTGENVFNEMNHFTFLLENMLWSFLPWIFIFLITLVLSIKDLIKSKFKLQIHEEFITVGGFILTYCMLARSQAQLPHYIFVVLPLAAIVTAKGLHQIYFSERFLKLKKVALYFHGFIFTLLWAAANMIVLFVFTDMPVYVKIVTIIGTVYFLYLLFFYRGQAPKFISLALFTILGVNFILNTSFYPRLLRYELGVSAAAFINQNKLPKNSVYLYEIDESRALHFYGNHSFERLFDSSMLTPGQILITKASSFTKLQQQFPGSTILHKNAYFGVSMLTLPFLNPATRDKEVTPYIIVTLAK